MGTDTEAMTPRQVARRYHVGVHKVLTWIATGQLAAVNVATDLARRPRWIVMADALTQFEQRRAASPSTPPRRRRERRPTQDSLEFF